MSRYELTEEELHWVCIAKQRAVRAVGDLVEEHGPMNPRPIIEAALWALTAAIVASENPAMELQRVLQVLPEMVEEEKLTVAQWRKEEPQN